MQHCKRCEIEKQPSDFYPKDKTCKDCRKAMVRAYREENIDQIREYDRRRGSDPSRVAAAKAYQQTDAGREASNAAKRRYIKSDPRRRSAHIEVNNAIRCGKLTPTPCCMAPGCYNTTNVEGHHFHYGEPLAVVWLCEKCHKQVHKEHRERERHAAH